MIQIIIIIIFILLFLFLRNIYEIICEEDNNKTVVINENDNQFILFKRNDSVSDMKILNILYQCDNEFL
jgi:hypothetical protein